MMRTADIAIIAGGIAEALDRAAGRKLCKRPAP
jgi:hypothetical protein